MSPNSPEEILRLAWNFMENRILLTGAELNIFGIISQASLTAQDVSSGQRKRGVFSIYIP
jgi:hypothetical protein